MIVALLVAVLLVAVHPIVRRSVETVGSLHPRGEEAAETISKKDLTRKNRDVEKADVLVEEWSVTALKWATTTM